MSLISRPTCCLLAVSVFSLAQSHSADWSNWRGPLTTGAAPGANPPTHWSESSNVVWKVKIPGAGTSTPIISGNLIFLQSAIPTGRKIEPEPKPAEAAPQATPPPPAPAGEGGGSERRRRGPGGGGGGGGGMRAEKPNEFHQFAVIALDRKTGAIRWQTAVKEELPHEGHHRDHGFASHSPVTDGETLFGYFGSRGLHALGFDGKIKWSKDLGQMRTRNSFGEGSSPALHGNSLVVQWDHEGEDFIAAFDKNTGKELWRQKRDEPTTWSTPLILSHEGVEQVIASSTGRVRSYELTSGKQLWECAGMTVSVIPTPMTGFGMVYVMSGFRGAALLAITLGKQGDLTGTDAIRWQLAKSTPYVPSGLLSGERIYFFSGNNGLLSIVDAKSGAVKVDAQRIEGLSGVYASPVAAAGRVYLTGRDGTCVVIKDSDSVEVLGVNRLTDRIDASPAVVGQQLFLRGHQHLYCLAAQ
ncbi:MAG: hypothetical protein FJ405_05235 [Verrucomicrobia bacterium]|nr:hypothetical protein [Verrucomicrobiota bacterium]